MATENNKQSILRRLKIAEGHLKKVISMIEDDRYCIEVLQQSSAVRSALKKTQDLILARHLQTCVKNALKEDKREKVVAELVDIYLQSK
jgi:DNA-binding FrmR family transcriptional regulator